MNLQKKSAAINTLLYDLKAEFLIALLLSEGMSQKDIMVVFDGVLKRKWSTDINYSEVEEFENGDETFSIHLNRAGIYDALPEALFHRFSDIRNSTGEDMAKESMRLKAEEKHVRLFFRPFENEIFFRNVFVAMKENRKFQDLYSEFLNGLIPGFWRIDEKIPQKYISKLTRLLPFAHQVTGNYSLTARCIEFVLDEQVRIEFRDDEVETARMSGHDTDKNDMKGGCLGAGRLGYDMIAGRTASGYIGRLLIHIGPLKNTDPKDFFKGGPADLTLNCIYSYFIPVELDVETRLKAEKKENFFILTDDAGVESEMSYLGYNTAI